MVDKKKREKTRRRRRKSDRRNDVRHDGHVFALGAEARARAEGGHARAISSLRARGCGGGAPLWETGRQCTAVVPRELVLAPSAPQCSPFAAVRRARGIPYAQCFTPFFVFLSTIPWTVASFSPLPFSSTLIRKGNEKKKERGPLTLILKRVESCVCFEFLFGSSGGSRVLGELAELTFFLFFFFLYFTFYAFVEPINYVVMIRK